MDILYNILSIVSSLLFFLFGMRLMSESLLKEAGGSLRGILSTLTANRFRGILSGLLITVFIQFSSATTVMIVGFVNAGLVSLFEATSLIMGANIGTTVKTMFLSKLGLKINMLSLAYPFIIIGFPLFFSKKLRIKNVGEFLLSFAIILIGLELLKRSIPEIQNNPAILEWLSNFQNYGFFSSLLFLVIGVILTVIVQSSSAMMTLTIILSHNGWISYELAAAMVIGENIGTTVTANLSALMANVQGKRAALIHTLFNVFGALWALPLLGPILYLIDHIVVDSFGNSAHVSVEVRPFALAIFHLFFNVTNTLILMNFIPYLVKASEKLIKSPVKMDNLPESDLPGANLINVKEVSMLIAEKEINSYMKYIKEMFEKTEMLFKIDKELQNNLYYEIKNFEKSCDDSEIQIAEYLLKVAEQRYNPEVKTNIFALLKILNEFENMGDSIYKIAKVIKKKKDENVYFSYEMIKNIEKMLSYLHESFELLHQNMYLGYGNVTDESATILENKINAYRDLLKQENMMNLGKNEYSYKQGMLYQNIIVECENIGDNQIFITRILAKKVM